MRTKFICTFNCFKKCLKQYLFYIVSAMNSDHISHLKPNDFDWNEQPNDDSYTALIWIIFVCFICIFIVFSMCWSCYRQLSGQSSFFSSEFCESYSLLWENSIWNFLALVFSSSQSYQSSVSETFPFYGSYSAIEVDGDTCDTCCISCCLQQVA